MTTIVVPSQPTLPTAPPFLWIAMCAMDRQVYSFRYDHYYECQVCLRCSFWVYFEMKHRVKIWSSVLSIMHCILNLAKNQDFSSNRCFYPPLPLSRLCLCSGCVYTNRQLTGVHAENTVPPWGHFFLLDNITPWKAMRASDGS